MISISSVYRFRKNSSRLGFTGTLFFIIIPSRLITGLMSDGEQTKSPLNLCEHLFTMCRMNKYVGSTHASELRRYGWSILTVKYCDVAQTVKSFKMAIITVTGDKSYRFHWLYINNRFFLKLFFE